MNGCESPKMMVWMDTCFNPATQHPLIKWETWKTHIFCLPSPSVANTIKDPQVCDSVFFK